MKMRQFSLISTFSQLRQPAKIYKVQLDGRNWVARKVFLAFDTDSIKMLSKADEENAETLG